MAEAIGSPPVTSSVSELLDWLELVCFFSDFGIARLDVVDSALKEQREEQESNIGIQDREIERLREAIENEFEDRLEACGDAYPFQLTGDGEELHLIEDWSSERCLFYFVCLFASHVSGSPLIDASTPDELVSQLRNRVFQIVSTITMAGFARGSAASIGWPREAGEAILVSLRRAQERGAGILVRDEPGPYANPKAKDGGVDAIAWSIEDRLPPTRFYYAQVASGRNWRGKPVQTHVSVFEPNYMDDPPRCEVGYTTLIPFRPKDISLWFNEHKIHGCLLDRTRIPRYGRDGLQMIANGVEMDESENLDEVRDWIEQFSAHLNS